MSTVCQVCGVRGFVEALNFCSICRVSAQHRYCLEIIPKVLHEEVFWVCKDCSSIEVKDENYVETEVVRSKFQISPKRTHFIEAEKVCTAFEVPKSVRSNDNSLPLRNPQRNSEIRAQPTLDPIWRGTMNIQNRNWTLHGLGAHLSTLAHSKISSVTSLFPNLLPLEILPRTAVWPKRFSSSTTLQDADIALYFFPLKISDEREFDDLLDDMMLNDLAIKASFDIADLLIFTSLQLPMQHWRYKKKLYLWGLFSREKFFYKSTQQVTPRSR